MWAGHRDLIPIASYSPTLYGLGTTIEAWAREALNIAQSDRLIVVGCSVGGSCAIEVAIAAPERVAAIILIGTKAEHRPDPVLHASALDLIQKKGINPAWAEYWAPLFSASTDRRVIEAARNIALRQNSDDIACGVTAFHSRKSRGQFVSQCQIPIVVLSGEDDTAPGPKAGALLAASAPHGSFRLVPSCGHYLPLERPHALSGTLVDVYESLTCRRAGRSSGRTL